MMPEEYEMPYTNLNKEENTVQSKYPSIPGYTKNSTVLQLFALNFISTVGVGLLVYFLAGGSREVKVVFPTQSTTTSTQIPKQTESARLSDERVGNVGGASMYVRWGRTTCPENGTELVYEGYAGGSRYKHTGAAVNYLCMPKDPIWGVYNDELQDGAYVYGGEYQFNYRQRSAFFSHMKTDIIQHDAPCAVCRSPRASVLMVPGRNMCHNGWTLEYAGYLTAGKFEHDAASEYACLDVAPEILIGGSGNNDGKLFYFVEGRCGTLKCPPYVNGREITCAVCTK